MTQPPTPVPIADRITGALADCLVDGELPAGGMPHTWVLAATYYDADGEQRLVLETSEGAPVHETLGLLDIAGAAYRDAALSWVRGDPPREE